MKTSPGIAAKMFRTLADEDVNIEMISTSTIRISVVVATARPRTRRPRPAHGVRARQRPGAIRRRSPNASRRTQSVSSDVATGAGVEPAGRLAQSLDGPSPPADPVEDGGARVSEQYASADEVIRQTGWVFNNETGSQLTLDEFVATGDNEVLAYLDVFGLRTPDNDERTLVEIGCGIGRMTCAFSREFAIGVRLRPRRRLPRALPRDRRPVRQGRPAPHDRGRRRAHARRPDRRRRPRVQLHHAPALRDRRRARPRRRGRAGRATGRQRRAQLPVALGRRRGAPADRRAHPQPVPHPALRAAGWRNAAPSPGSAWQANRLHPDTVLGRCPTRSPTSRSGATRAATCPAPAPPRARSTASTPTTGGSSARVACTGMRAGKRPCE